MSFLTPRPAVGSNQFAFLVISTEIIYGERMSNSMTMRSTAETLDTQDPLAKYRQQFLINDPLLCYLDALDDAVKLDPMRAPSEQALLASVALRLGYA